MRAVTILAVTVGCATFGAAAAHAITSKQFAARANKICKRSNADLRKIPQPQKKSEIKGFLRRTVAVVRPAQRRIEQIPLPKDKRATARDAVRTSRKVANVYITASQRVDRGADPVRELSQIPARLVKVRSRQTTLWKRLGARDCT